LDPHLVDVLAVHANGKDLDVQVLKLAVPSSDRCDFRWSNEGEISGVKEQHDPMATVVREFEIPEAALVKDGRFEVRGLFAYDGSGRGFIGLGHGASSGAQPSPAA
jgi:hypothetical protein